MIKTIFLLFCFNIFVFLLKPMPMESEVVPIPDEAIEEIDVSISPPETERPETIESPADVSVQEVQSPQKLEEATQLPPAAPLEVAPPFQSDMGPNTESIPAQQTQDFSEAKADEESVGIPVNQEELEVNKQKQELEQVKIDIDLIEQQEDSLMAKLSELENQMNQAQGKETSARQTKKQILNAQTVEQAKQLLNQLNMIADQIQGVQDRLQGPFSQEFNNIVSQIQGKIQSVNAKINEIKNINASIIPAQNIEVPIVVKKKVKLKSPFAQKTADVIAFIIDSFLDIIYWLKNLFNRILQKEEVIDKIGVVTTAASKLPQEVLQSDDLSEKLDSQMKNYEKKIKNLSEKKKKIKKEEIKIEEKRRLLNELKQQKKALKKYQVLMNQLGLVMNVAKKERGEIRTKLEFAFGKVLDFGSYVLEKIGVVSSGIYNRIFLPRLEKFILAVKQRVEEDEKNESEPSPPPPMDMTLHSTGMEPVAPAPPQPMSIDDSPIAQMSEASMSVELPPIQESPTQIEPTQMPVPSPMQ